MNRMNPMTHVLNVKPTVIMHYRNMAEHTAGRSPSKAVPLLRGFPRRAYKELVRWADYERMLRTETWKIGAEVYKALKESGI